MKTTNIVDVLITNIKEDQELLNQADEKIEKAKEEKRVITDRLKDCRRDIIVMSKYANETQQKQIAELGFDSSENQRGLNTVASIAFDIVLETKDNQLTNAQLYEEYTKRLKNKSDAVNYTEFNIKCRSLFNTQRLLRKKGSDPKSSRTDIISLNGRVHNPEDKNEK